MSTVNIAAELIDEHVKISGEKPVDIYQRMGLSRHAFYRMFRAKKREPTLKTLARLRVGLNWSRKKFWDRVQDVYDPKA